LTKIAMRAGCEATAVSQQTAAGDGYFQFTAAETNKERWVGVMRSGKAVSVRNIDFAFLLGGVGGASIRESGASTRSFPLLSKCDLLDLCDL
jgi:hypothetical protein